MATNTNQKLAVLIDADNAQASVIQELLVEVSRYGTATIKRAYGDWTTTNLRGWKDVLHTMAIQPVQQFAYTSGKNATDSALIINAMDVLHTGSVDGFCLVSSDSDFTRLATRICMCDARRPRRQRLASPVGPGALQLATVARENWL
jgi:uncharacterized LabA/DUF88 family protein